MGNEADDMEFWRQPVASVMHTDVETAHQDETLEQAATRMRLKNVGLLPVLDGEEIVGVVTDRDITVRATAYGHDPKSFHVRDVKTGNVVHAREDQTLEQAAAIMEGARVRRLPVLDERRHLVGIISFDDLARLSPSRGAVHTLAGRTAAEPRRPGEMSEPYAGKPKLPG